MPTQRRYHDSKGSALMREEPSGTGASSTVRPNQATSVTAPSSQTDEWATVTSQACADFLCNPRTAALIHPFIGRELTIKHAAERLQISPLRMFRAVKRMESLGLLEVTRVVSRRGRPLKHYRASSDRYFIPYRVTGEDTLESFLMHQDDNLRRVFVRSFADYLLSVLNEQGSDPGRLIYRDAGGSVMTHSVGGLDDPRGIGKPVLEDDAYVGWSNFSVVKLDLARSRELKRELVALFEKYRAHSGERSFVVRLGMAPLKDKLMDLLER
jgi:hypothetical protein